MEKTNDKKKSQYNTKSLKNNIFLSLILTIIISILITNTNATIQTLNNNNQDTTYFSFSNDFTKIITTKNKTNLTIAFDVNNITQNKTYTLTPCQDNNYCSNFYLKNILQSAGGTFTKSIKFNINIGNEKKTIYLDLENPTINVTKQFINIKTKQIEFEFNYNDDTNQFSKIELYEKENNNLNYIANLTSLNLYNFNINESKTYTFTFKIFDLAKNMYEQEISIQTLDIFSPEIIDTELILEDNKYQLYLSIKDKQLQKYEIIQNSIILSEDITGETFSKTINIPFTSGNIILKVTDNNTNTIEKTILLSSPIKNTYYNKYSNTKEFKFESNAQNCYIIKINAQIYSNRLFSKNNNIFSYNLYITSTQNYNIEFYCTINNFKQYFTTDFFYDTNKPQEISDFIIEKIDEGYLKIEWEESIDGESEVTYVLYRDNKEIYDGSKLYFTDKDVEYPNKYEYYIKVKDEAENKIESIHKYETPNKININFKTSMEQIIQTQKNNYNLNFQTDIKSNIKILVKNLNKIIFEKEIKNTTTKEINQKISLLFGINNVYITIEDEFNNKETKTFFITLEEPINLQPKVEKKEIIIKKEIPKNTIEENNITNSTTTINNEKYINNLNELFWPIFFILIFVLFIWYFIINEDKLKSCSIKKINYTKRKKKSKTKKFLFNRYRNKDNLLEKDFKRIKKNRINRQKEKQEELQKEKQQEEKRKTKTIRSSIHKQKIQDLSNTHKDVFIPFKKKTQAKQRTTKIKQENNYNQEQKKIYKKKEKDLEKEDKFNNYLTKIKQNKSWHSTTDYRAKKEEPKSTKENTNMQPQKKKNKLQEKPEEQQPTKEKKTKEKIQLDNYLGKILKKKKGNNFYFAEKAVERDLK